MAVIEQSTAGGVDAFNGKITYVACRVAHDHRTPEPQQRLADLEAEGVVTPNLGSCRSPDDQERVNSISVRDTLGAVHEAEFITARESGGRP